MIEVLLKSIALNAIQWKNHGDDNNVKLFFPLLKSQYINSCVFCNKKFYDHGLLITQNNKKIIICPNDWILFDKTNPLFSLKPHIFEQIIESI